MVRGKRDKGKRPRKRTIEARLTTARACIVIGLQLAGEVIKLIHKITNN